jgi:hypothetical protein
MNTSPVESTGRALGVPLGACPAQGMALIIDFEEAVIAKQLLGSFKRRYLRFHILETTSELICSCRARRDAPCFCTFA